MAVVFVRSNSLEYEGTSCYTLRKACVFRIGFLGGCFWCTDPKEGSCAVDPDDLRRLTNQPLNSESQNRTLHAVREYLSESIAKHFLASDSSLYRRFEGPLLKVFGLRGEALCLLLWESVK
jgi:hypothetical protein